MTLKAAFHILIPALVPLAAKRGRNKPCVFALSAAIVLVLSAGVGVAQDQGGGTQQYPPPPPNTSGVTLWGYGFGSGPAGACSASETTSACADKYQATFTTSGSLYGTMIAPPPGTSAFGVPCTTSLPTICSNGIRQDGTVSSPPGPNNPNGGLTGGVINVVYDNYPTLCRFVDNTSANDLFVPQASLQEFADFVNHAPTKVGFGYCTLGVSYNPYTATASFPTGFYITATGGPAEPAPLPPSAQTQLSVTLPTTRVVTGTLAPQTPQTATFNYTRYDCWPGTTPATPSSCNARAIIESQSLLFSVNPSAHSSCTNPASATGINCNGSWTSVPTVSCTVDGVYYGPAGKDSCLADYSPPVVNGVCSNPSVKDTCLTGLVDPASESYDAATSTSTWICDGEPGPPSTDSGPCSFVNAVNGVCNDALKDSCSAGKVNVASETYVPGPPASYTWSCNGLGAGSSSGLPLCTTAAAANGVCGVARYSCSPGSAVGESDNGTTSSWICDGIAGGSPSGPCSSADNVPGVCNDASQYSCAPGTPANETDNGTTSTWTCDGLGAGADSGLCSMADPGCAGGKVNGACNDALRYSCAEGTPTSESDNGTTSTWTCAGSCGGTNDTTCSNGDIINGACNDAIKYSCADGTPINEGHDAAASTWTWDCAGINGGTTTSPSPACSSPDAVAGVCGGPRYTCAPGTAVSETDNGTTSKWLCDGIGGGASSPACSSSDPINGACGGAADSCTSPAAPSGYVAAAGTWTCPGSNGGTNASCNTGVCGGSVDTCTAGTAAGYDAGAGTWTCDGSGSGTNVSCSVSGGTCGRMAMTCTTGTVTDVTIMPQVSWPNNDSSGELLMWSCTLNGVSTQCSPGWEICAASIACGCNIGTVANCLTIRKDVFGSWQCNGISTPNGTIDSGPCIMSNP